MASGMNTDEAPPLPPPDYRPQTTEEFAKQKQPPMRGLIVDPKYPPTASEAQAIWDAKDAEAKRTSSMKAPPPNFSPPESSQFSSGIPRPSQELGSNVRRSSGTSQILNTAAAPRIEEEINTMPGGSYHTAGGRAIEQQEPTVLNAIRMVNPAEFTSLHQLPCVREAFLQGFFAGFLVSGITIVTGRPVIRAVNNFGWAFLPTSVVGFQYCQYQRGREREGMRQAIRIVEQKKEERAKMIAEKREKWLALKEEKRLAEEREEAHRRESEKRWWKIWQRGSSSEKPKDREG
ncbi:cytochrome oxidase biogenesis protein Cox20 subunit [Venturia nashicola]|uniref:Cytochrome c oxidase assembly protein COX20, mitochondrial n=1 Tax=Venturia nashicola TaxID=86259 RepID=A0A4Z1NID6_9PEZI|nr:cytochrome oxidase biogenesis protein Cox20 subunit [Venturia nashicola]TLD20118.1 cytochrome oxidase biogenesis protein Cox20 subunit [Venturia nashicola]